MVPDRHNHPGAIRRRRTAILVAAAVFCLLAGACVPKPKVYRVGILAGLEPLYDIADSFRTRMTEMGYVEGKNIVYDLQMTNSEPAKEKPILRKFVADKVDLILTFPSEQAILAKEITQGTEIPVIFCHTNIEGTGLVRSLREPGGNVTGVRYPGPDLAVKRLEILHELAPRARRVWVPYLKDSKVVPAQIEVLRTAADQLGLTLVEAPFAGAEEILADLEKRSKTPDIGFDAILLIIEPLVKSPGVYPKISKIVKEHRVPIGGVINPTISGNLTLFGVTTDNHVAGRLAAQQADKVLKGTPAGTIPVISGESYFQLNYKLAQEQGLAVPDSLLRQANEVIR